MEVKRSHNLCPGGPVRLEAWFKSLGEADRRCRFLGRSAGAGTRPCCVQKVLGAAQVSGRGREASLPSA